MQMNKNISECEHINETAIGDYCELCKKMCECVEECECKK
jgi:hypothetical protein